MSEKCKMHYLPIKPSDKSLPIHIEEKSGANYKSASAMFDVGAALATKQCRLFHNTCPASPQSTQGKSRPADLHTCRLARVDTFLSASRTRNELQTVDLLVGRNVKCLFSTGRSLVFYWLGRNANIRRQCLPTGDAQRAGEDTSRPRACLRTNTMGGSRRR
ncbi:hypothetical protein J6590_092788 [Homalodisca vitripennis]|nr:hypothetical protein J6590_092788 [Homalodisca vitripennis]